MKRLNTWVISPFAPTDHNVGWVDTSDEKGWVARMYNGAHVEDVPNPTPEQLGWDPVAGITEEEIKKLLDAKQDKLVSGENIKTLGNKDLLGEGNIAIKLTTNASTPNVLRIKLDSDTASSQAFKTINGETLLGEGDISLSTEDDLVFEKGTGNNSVQQKGTGVKAIGQSSIAAGTGESSKSSYTVSGAANATTYTTSAAHGLSVGDVVNFHSVYARIIAVNNTTSFTVDTTLDSSVGLGGAKINIIKGVAFGSKSATFGDKNTAIGDASFAEGSNTKATNLGEHAEGVFNKSNPNTRHSVGIGTADNDRKNAFEIMQNGKAYLHGVGRYDGTNPNAAGVQSLQDVLGTTVWLDVTRPTDIEQDKIYSGNGILRVPEDFDVVSCTVVNYSTDSITIECWRNRVEDENAQTFTLAPFQVLAFTCTIDEQQGSIWTASDSHYQRESDIFWATYGTTPVADMLAAYNAGKIVACVDNDNSVFVLAQVSNTALVFNNPQKNRIAWFTINISDGTWSQQSVIFAERTAYKTSDIESNKTNTDKYTTTKGVYDFVAATAVCSTTIRTMVTLTQQDYDDLQNKDASTLYIIV